MYEIGREEDVSLEISKNSNEINICSVGRFCEAKNFENIPKISKRIIDLGVNIKWYIIGFGPYEDLINKRIKEYGVEQNVIVLGKKINPYPYIKACDYYIQPSRYEGKAVTVREAQMLYKPVIITDFATAKSQVNNGVDGIIVSQNEKKCADEIFKIITNEQITKNLINNTKKIDYSNKNEVNKLYQLIE